MSKKPDTEERKLNITESSYARSRRYCISPCEWFNAYGVLSARKIKDECSNKTISKSAGNTLTFINRACLKCIRNRKHISYNAIIYREISLYGKGGCRAAIGLNGKHYPGNFDSTLARRKNAESVIHDACLLTEKNPLYFDVKKTGGILEVISNNPEFDGNRIVVGEKAFIFKQSSNVLPIISSFRSEASPIKPE